MSTIPFLQAAHGEFNAEQKEYLTGFLTGIARRGEQSLSGATRDAVTKGNPAPEGEDCDSNTKEDRVFGTPRSELCKQEQWKLDEDPLEIWDKLLAHAEEGKFPDEADAFRFRYHGLFYVAPAQNSLMLRCRIPGGELTSEQMKGLAEIADAYGGGYADVTTRSNLQIREIAPANIVKVLTKLQELGLTARGSGVDNIRNITASPTAGIDPQELIDTRPFAKALHHYILNRRDMYGLPRKFNVAFDGGGSVSVVADTNDIGFTAVRVPKPCSEADQTAESSNAAVASGISLEDGSPIPLEPGVYFRVALAGITGHKQLARDSGLLIEPDDSIAVAAAMIRVFNENGCRTDRKKARLKYLLDEWGTAKFLEKTQEKLAFPLVQFPLERCERAHTPLKHGHIGVYKQAQRGLNYMGVVIPVGRMQTRQMRRLADLARHYGSGELRLTPWQNLIIANVPDGFVETVKRNLVRIGFHYEATTIAGGLVACTGNTGCKYASTNTKSQALELARYLEQRVALDQPINIHLTGCPHSCAQHYIGDIGLLGVKTMLGGESVEAYNVVLGGGSGHQEQMAKEVFKGIPFSSLPKLLERILTVYKRSRTPGETLAQFTRRHEVKQLQELFSE